MSRSARRVSLPGQPCQADSAAHVKQYLSLDLGIARPVGYRIIAHRGAEIPVLPASRGRVFCAHRS
jgi:hypothetical protein